VAIGWATSTVHIGRQPIYGAMGALYGFELLFRADVDARTAAADGDAATTATLLAAFSEFPLPDLLGGLPGFVNLTRAFLTGELPIPFDPGLAVLEILETVTADAQVVGGVSRLRDQGYQLAMDDFVWSAEAEPLLDLVSIVKVDVLALTWDEIMTTVERCRRPGLRLLAEKVEDQAMLERCLGAGFELFQGYFLGRPQTLSAGSLTPEQSMALQLLGRLSDPAVSIDEVEAIMRPDPGLTYRLLRLANSSANGLPRTVSSIRDAVVLVGLQRLRAWMVLISLSTGAGGTDVSMALTRARTCELIARSGSVGDVRPDVAFTLGLLDGIAETLALTRLSLLEGMPPLGAQLSSALLGEPGGLRTILDAELAYETRDVEALGRASVPTPLVAASYLAAIAWTSRTTGPARVAAAQ
jgi:c-di-GMP-related signal transduction protein